jgi:hypothetical protein
VLAVTDAGGTNTLVLGSGLTSSNVVLSESTNGHDMLITDGVSGDTITLSAQITGTIIKTLVYGDSSTLDLTGGLTLTAQPGNSSLATFVGTNTLIAVGSNSGTETLIGNTGSDTYSYSSGDGKVFIVDTSGTDTLKLGSGLIASNIFFTDNTTATDLIITDGVSGDTITLHSQSTAPVETLVYGDGSTLSLSGVKMATSSATTLNGTTGNEILVPSTSNLTLAGKGGNDTYDFGAGMGKDFINNGVSTTNSANGTLFFGHGIGDNQLWFDRVDNSGTISTSGNNLRIDIMGSTTLLTINGWYIGGSSTYEQLSEFQVSDSGLKLDSQLANLVSAMATFETNYAAGHGGTPFDPTAVSSISDTTVLAAVSSDWH